VEQFDRMIAVNLRSAFLVSRRFVPAMVKRRRGDVFFISSIAGIEAYPRSTAYCAAKFGVTGLAKVLREETKTAGCACAVCFPGQPGRPHGAEAASRASG